MKKINKLIYLGLIFVLSSCANENFTNNSNNNYQEIMHDELIRFNLTDKVGLNIYYYGTINQHQLDRNEKSNISPQIKEKNDQIFMIDYKIEDERVDKNEIALSKENSDKDIVELVLYDKDDNIIKPVSFTTSFEQTGGSYFCKSYYIIKDKNNLDRFEVHYDIDGDKSNKNSVIFQGVWPKLDR